MYEEYIKTGKVVYIYRQFPLPFHRHAVPASEASLCAADQGKFWPLHDRIYETLEQWSGLNDARDHFKMLAGEVGLNTETFNECFDGRKKLEQVQADAKAAAEAGARGTPFFLVGKQALGGAQPFEAFQQAIEAQLP
ncbi:MAG: thioredoxin domain-containing protein [Chloroflexi bacterium]|nr:thioredoxin domain-containing protein [Chloroflexota bacterium]